MTAILIHIFVLLLLPPLLLGIITRTKAWFAGRRGPPFIQPYYEIARLMRRGLIISDTTTPLFIAGPVVTLAAVILAGLLVPMGGRAPISFTGDVFLFAYIFALARFATTAAALDTGSAFEGMGAARELTFACLTEPALFLGFLVLGKLAGTPQLDAMLHVPAGAFAAGSAAPLVMVAAGFFIVMLSENCRIPVDDPTTHLELTMIHEAMVLDHSGPLFGTILYGSAVKLLVLGTLVLRIIIPPCSGQPWLSWLVFVAGLLLLSVAIGIVESVMARLRMRRVPQLLAGALFCCGFGFILLIR